MQTENKQTKKCRRAVKAIVFLAIVAVVFAVVNFIAQPIWDDYTYNPTHGIYEEPQDTIETLFLGSSHVRSGFSPIDLYEEYGICSYDISTPQQPVKASYFWVEEVYRLNPDTLDTVVLDVSTFLHGTGKAKYHQAIDPMRFSLVKLRAVKAGSDDFTDFISMMIPVMTYHERWKELTEEDFTKFTKEPQVFLRGQHYDTEQWVDHVSDFSKITIPEMIVDEDAEEVELYARAVKYFKKMVSFCDEHDIKLVLVKAPTYWTSSKHNAVQELADSYGIDFIDFNFEPYYSESGFNFATDLYTPKSETSYHSNNFGAKKLTDYMGEYLISECGNRDVRGDAAYAFMDDELADYYAYVEESGDTDLQGVEESLAALLADGVAPSSLTGSERILYLYNRACEVEETVRMARQELGTEEDLLTYLRAFWDDEDIDIYITVQGDAAAVLTDGLRDGLAALGLNGLAGLGSQDAYLAVVDGGELLSEDAGGDGSALTLRTAGYSLKSPGAGSEETSSVMIGGTEYSPMEDGINVVVYDGVTESVVDTVVFGSESADSSAAEEVTE